MKRLILAVLLIAVSTLLASSARAQIGMDAFKKASFTRIFNPVVGQGAVGKESVDGKDGY